jgi:acetyl-CoA acetyltransferase
VVSAALAKVPALDPADVDDLYLGCAEPWAEQGANMARIVAVLLGLDGVPGATINRFCASSVQTTRMAYHAIKAGEGDVFISAGVECVSRYKTFAGRRPERPGVAQPTLQRRQCPVDRARRHQRHLDRPARRGPAAGRLPRHGTDGRERRHPARRVAG